MQALLEVILPVFLVIGAGYGVTKLGWFGTEGVDGLMKFAQNFAIPCLLFRAISTLDLNHGFDWAMMFGFYAGATTGFVAAFAGARWIFGRPIEDCVAIGFCGLFSNSVLLGLAITEQAYGPDALAANYTIIALHSPFCYGLGITVMEVVRARGQSPAALSATVLRAMFRNALILGIVLGFAANFSGVSLPEPLLDAIDMMVRAALPAALFGLGGVLVRYRPEGDMRVIIFVCAISLILHPLVTLGLGSASGISQAALRSSVLTAAMAPGINCYIFANMYGAARRVAASSVLVATALSILTVWGWLALLP